MNRYIFIFGLFILVISVPIVHTFEPYRDSIPNGYNVPHPCKPNYMWRGVGHEEAKGGGDRNVFGLDFKAAGKTWTQSLCQMDSDGDGKSNGEELGDPNCIWQVGTVPERTKNITHPGVCEPLNSDRCQNKSNFVSCNGEDFACDALNEVGMRNTTIQFPKMNITSDETQYYCMYFNFPTNGDYHMVANQPFVDNNQVLHHILMFGCDQPVTEDLYKPWKCGMGSYKCFSLIGIWAVGMSGTCLHKDTGFRLGYRGYMTGMIQVHYNNPDKRADFTDSSGLTLHYTSNRRRYDSRVLMLGQMYIEIPVGKSQYTVSGQCTSDCSNFQFNGPIQVTGAFNHMHYLGKQMKIEQHRNKTKVRDIAFDEVYSYDSPVQYQYKEPIIIEKGDEINVTCIYQSLNKRKTTFYGDATADEMCFGFLTYYPAENINYPYCLTWKNIPYCKLINSEVFPEIDGCRLMDIFNQSNPTTQLLMTSVLENCRPFHSCLPECLELLRTYKSHPCLNGDVGDYIRMQAQQVHNMTLFFAAIDSCKANLTESQCDCKYEKCTSASFSVRSSLEIISISALILIIFFIMQRSI